MAFRDYWIGEADHEGPPADPDNNTRVSAERLNASEVRGGRIGEPEPGAKDPERVGRFTAARFGYWFDDLHLRSHAMAMMSAREMNDPAEFRGGRTPGVNVMWLTGRAGTVSRKYPVGGSTVLAADVAAGASEFFLVRADFFPQIWDGSVADPVFRVGDQAITYTGRSTVSGVLCGAHALGATELTYASVTDFPSVGRAQGRGVNVAWTGRTRILDTTVNGAHKAGDTTLTLNGDISGIPATGTVRVTTVGGTVRTFRYASKSGQVLTLHASTPLSRNVDNGAAVVMDKLTGVTSDFQTTVDGRHEPGATQLRLKFDHGDAGVPSSGILRVETTRGPADEGFAVEAAGPGKYDHPVKEIAFTARSGDVLTLAAPLPDDVEDDAWVWIDGVTGLSRAQDDARNLVMIRMTGAAGFASGATRGQIVEFDPRYRGPLPINSTLFFLAGDAWSPGGFDTHSGLLALQSTEDAKDGRHRGGRWFHSLATTGPNSFRKQTMIETERGLGILGGDLASHEQILYPLHVAGWGARAQAPGFSLDPEAEPDPDLPPPTPGQVGTGTLYLTTTVGAPASARIRTEVHNRAVGVQETREFDYTGLGADKISLTGLSYDGADGYVLSDFFFQAGNSVRLADRVKHKTGVHKGQVVANEGGPGETVVGNVGPTIASPEAGVLMGGKALHKRTDSKVGWDSEVVATEAYADLVAQGVKWKTAVRVATTADISLQNLQTIDGVSLAAGDRVLVKNQTTQSQNGIYVVVAGGAWTRATDADAGTELESATVPVAEGTQNASTIWRQSVTPVTLGTTSLAWARISQLTEAGEGLTRTGSNIDVVAGSGIAVAADSVAAKPEDFNLTGTHAARPAAGTAGRTYFETDTGVLYRDSGAVWVALSPGKVRKTADESLTSDTTLQNDDHLFFPIEVGETWFVEAFLLLEAHTGGAADWKFGWTGPASAGAKWGIVGDPTTITGASWSAVGTAATPAAQQIISGTVVFGSGSSSGGQHALLVGRFVSAVNAGTIQLQWAQNTSKANPNIVKADSWLRLTRLA